MKRKAPKPTLAPTIRQTAQTHYHATVENLPTMPDGRLEVAIVRTGTEPFRVPLGTHAFTRAEWEAIADAVDRLFGHAQLEAR